MENSMYMDRYFLESKNDTTDVTAQIEQILRKHGMCLLGDGVFYVSGINMPENSTLMGVGNATKLILCPEVEDGYAIRLNSRCAVKNMSILGAEEETERPEAVGKRHGIAFLGNATGSDDSKFQHRNVTIEGCYIRSFTGGGIHCFDTGYSSICSITASNCHILYCGVGIDISRFSEYHEFTNMLCGKNLYGCINNGGNNVFVNCGFTGNTTGFVIDNSEGKSKNNSHGSAVGCTFNHSDSNKGIGIQLLNVQHGFVFSSCQIFFSKIVSVGSSGVVFNAFNFGKNEQIEVHGGELNLFTNCIFKNMPKITLTDNALVKMVNCYTRNAEEVTV